MNLLDFSVITYIPKSLQIKYVETEHENTQPDLSFRWNTRIRSLILAFAGTRHYAA